MKRYGLTIQIHEIDNKGNRVKTIEDNYRIFSNMHSDSFELLIEEDKDYKKYAVFYVNGCVKIKIKN